MKLCIYSIEIESRMIFYIWKDFFIKKIISGNDCLNDILYVLKRGRRLQFLVLFKKRQSFDSCIKPSCWAFKTMCCLQITLLLKYWWISYLYVCVSVLALFHNSYMHASACRINRDFRYSELELQIVWAACRCWRLNPGPLQGQKIFLTPEPFQHIQRFSFLL